MVPIERIKIANEIFVEHKFQKEFIIEQAKIIKTQEEINTTLLDINEDLKSKMLLNNKVFEVKEEIYNFNLNNHKKQNRLLKILIIASLGLNTYLIVK